MTVSPALYAVCFVALGLFFTGAIFYLVMTSGEEKR